MSPAFHALKVARSTSTFCSEITHHPAFAIRWRQRKGLPEPLPSSVSGSTKHRPARDGQRLPRAERGGSPYSGRGSLSSTPNIF